MTTVTLRPFVSSTDLPTILTLVRQSATAETLFDVPRYSDLASWLAPVGIVASTSREDEDYRHQMIQQATTLWETEAGEAVAYAVIPFTTSLRFGILPQWRSTQLARAILAWGLALLREQCRASFLMVRCHEQDVDLQTALTLEGFRARTLPGCVSDSSTGYRARCASTAGWIPSSSRRHRGGACRLSRAARGHLRTWDGYG